MNGAPPINLPGARANGSRTNGAGTARDLAVAPESTTPLFTAEAIHLQRRMRFNPIRTLSPEVLSQSLDMFDLGILRNAAMLWERIWRGDDTLITVKPALENTIAASPWQVMIKKAHHDDPEAARHAAALQYFYDNVTAVNAFDRNERGGLFTLIQQMMQAESYKYALHHLVWKPAPGKRIEVEGAAPVPALTAELEFVPLWFFENTTGTMRFLPFGGFGAVGEDMDFENGTWLCTTGRGVMFAASVSYVFKWMTFTDWTIFNERYAQSKVLGRTNAAKDSDQGRAMADMIANFNGDQGACFYDHPGEKMPIELLGPEGTASVEVFEKFIDRQDRKMTVMYRGSDLRQMSRPQDTTGVSAQIDETEALELAACKMIANGLKQLDALVIRLCFGEGVEPMAQFCLPDMDAEDATTLTASAGFLADRGQKVKASALAERLGIELAQEGDDADDVLQSAAAKTPPGNAGKPASDPNYDPNADTEDITTANGDVDGHAFHGNQWTAYHGTRAKFDEFSDHRAGANFPGVKIQGVHFTTDPAEAAEYADNFGHDDTHEPLRGMKRESAQPTRVIKAVIEPKNPLTVTAPKWQNPAAYLDENAKSLYKSAAIGGHDAIVVHGQYEPLKDPTNRNSWRGEPRAVTHIAVLDKAAIRLEKDTPPVAGRGQGQESSSPLRSVARGQGQTNNASGGVQGNSRPPGADSPALGRLLAVARHTFPEALAQDLKPLRTAIAEVLQGDDAGLPERARALEARMRAPDFIAQLIQAEGSDLALFKILSAAAASGLATEK